MTDVASGPIGYLGYLLVGIGYLAVGVLWFLMWGWLIWIPALLVYGWVAEYGW